LEHLSRASPWIAHKPWAAAEGSQPLAPTLRAIDLQAVRELGVAQAMREALAHLEREDGPDGFWIHLDVDVLDDAIMPAVDYHLPDGLSWDELIGALRAAVASDRAVGLEITIFNPALDVDGRIAFALVDALVAGLLHDLPERLTRFPERYLDRLLAYVAL
jgi:arginase